MKYKRIEREICNSPQTGLIRNQLFGVTPMGPMTIGTVSLVLIGVALLACYVPALRAAKADPMTALRVE